MTKTNFLYFMLKRSVSFVYLVVKDVPHICKWVLEGGFKDKPITIKNVKNYFSAFWNKTHVDYVYINEQVEWRRSGVEKNSPQCLKKGACVHCGCEFPDKLYEDDACEFGCYPQWLDKEQWSALKTLNDE